MTRTVRRRRSGVSKSRRRWPRGAGRWLLLVLTVGIAGAVWWDRLPRAGRLLRTPGVAEEPPAAFEPPSGTRPSPGEPAPGLLSPPPSDLAAPVLEVGKPAQARANPAASQLVGPENGETYPRPARTVLEAQVALARQVISSGSIDGVWGETTRRAVLAFQEREGLPLSGELDARTRNRLLLDAPVLTTWVLTADDFAGLQPLSPTWLGKSQQLALEHETVLERLAERSQASPTLLRRLNPGLDWERLSPGLTVQVPLARYPPPRAPAVRLVIRLSEKWVRAYDAEGRVLAHFPCSIAARVEKRPLGRLEVVAVAENPNYTFDPELFPESEEGRVLGRKLILPPGPNNPVGLAWIGLSLPGYGIHGTPHPERIGRTESHGCFRLTNWDALYLLRLVHIGMPVEVEP
jgi:lipoprotein-anchoring transpeptidase ErfK/SrfK